jgi:hypothetical protein
MRDVRRPAILVTFLALTWGAIGCEEQTPLGSSGSPGAYEARPMGMQPVGQTVENVIGGTEGSGPQPDWLVRVNARDHSIRSIAVSEQYVYFVAFWEGIYRVPKTGGPIEVVEAARQTQFEPVTATGNAVYWVRTTFDKDNDYPHLQIRRRLDDGSPSQLLFEGDWAVAWSNRVSTFQADDSGVYLVGHTAGGPSVDLHRVATGSGRIQPVFPINSFGWPSWVLQPEGLYLVNCFNNSLTDCTLGIVAKDGDGALVPLVSLDTGAELYAADAENLYLMGSGIWKVSKQGGTPIELVPARPIRLSSQYLLVDGTHVYFSTSSDPNGHGNAIQLWGLPKAGGPPASLGGGIAIANVLQIEQDRDRLYLLRSNGGGEGTEISVISKR